MTQPDSSNIIPAANHATARLVLPEGETEFLTLRPYDLLVTVDVVEPIPQPVKLAVSIWAGKGVEIGPAWRQARPISPGRMEFRFQVAFANPIERTLTVDFYYDQCWVRTLKLKVSVQESENECLVLSAQREGGGHYLTLRLTYQDGHSEVYHARVWNPLFLTSDRQQIAEQVVTGLKQKYQHAGSRVPPSIRDAGEGSAYVFEIGGVPAGGRAQCLLDVQEAMLTASWDTEVCPIWIAEP